MNKQPQYKFARQKSCFLSAVIFLVLIFTSGCQSAYVAKVDALNHPTVKLSDSNTFSIASDSIDDDGLRFRELKSNIETAFIQSGFVLANDPESADFIIKASLELSPPIHTVQNQLNPTYYSTHGYSQVIALPVRDENGKITHYRYSEAYTPPQIQFSGYVNQSRSLTVFDKILHLTAYAPKQGNALEEVWTLTAYHRSTDKDLRKNLPYLIAAAMPYFGKQTAGEILVKLDHKDPTLIHLKNANRSESK